MRDEQTGQLIADPGNVIIDGEIAWVPAFLGDAHEGNTIRFIEQYLDGYDNVCENVVIGEILDIQRIQDVTRPYLAIMLESDTPGTVRNMGVNAKIWISCRPAVAS